MAGPVRTQFAMKAVGLADLFKTIVGAHPVVSTEGPSFQVELSAPEGMSTGGGKQSVQHLSLVRDGLTIVAGSADQAEQVAELRSYDYVANLHAERYRGAALPIERAAYDELLKRARTFFASQDLAIVVKDAAPRSAAPVRAQSGGSSMTIIVVVIALAVAAGVFYFLRMR